MGEPTTQPTTQPTSQPYASGLDVAALTAIDVHTHAETDGCGHYSLPEELRLGADKYFGADGGGPPTLDQLAAYYRERRMAAVVFLPELPHNASGKLLKSRLREVTP